MHLLTHMLCLAAVFALSVASAIESNTFVRTFNVSGPVDLDVATGAGHITVKSGGASAVEIRGSVKLSSDWATGHESEVAAVLANPPIEQSGNTIRVGPIKDETQRRHISISYDILTPAETKLRAKSGAGAISVDGVHGPVDATTGAGSVHIAQVDRDVVLSSGAGRVEVESVKGRVDARTGSGSISGKSIGGAIKANTGSGSVQLEQTSLGPVEAHTGSGSVSVHLPAQAAFNLTARSGWGKITVDHPLETPLTKDQRNVNSKVRGGGPLVDLSTGSGSVRVQ